jgi:hypothetical protein
MALAGPVGGPHNVLAATRRDKGWSRPSEPDDLRDEEFWCQLPARRPYVRFCGVGAAADEGARTETQDIGRGIRPRVTPLDGSLRPKRQREPRPPPNGILQYGLAVTAASRARLGDVGRVGVMRIAARLERSIDQSLRLFGHGEIIASARTLSATP